MDPPAAQKEGTTSPDSAQKSKVEPAKTTASGVDPVIKKVEVTQINAAKPEGQVIPPASSGGPNTVTSTEVRQRKTKSSPVPAEYVPSPRGGGGVWERDLSFLYVCIRHNGDCQYIND